MSESDELDQILNEIKNMGDKESGSFSSSSNTPEDKETARDAIENFSANTNKEDKYNQKESYISDTAEYEDYEEFNSGSGGNGDNKKKIITIVAVIAVVALIIGGVIFTLAKNKDKEPETTTAPKTTQQESTTAAPEPVVNPLTGSEDFNEKAVGKRPIACVVENAAAARPQWGIDDDKNPPDIIVEGEVEGGETRMLWLYADYTAVPDQIGPMRSARPPYIKFSELFDAIFLHWGQSQTKRGTAYIGANTVFRVDKVDHINEMTYSGSVKLFGRDKSRGVSSEHTGVMYGAEIANAIKGEGFRTKADEKHYTKFSFNKEDKKLGDTACNALGLTFSSRTHTRDWSYSADDKMYHSSDYRTDVKRKNLLVLFDNTEYISKANYKGSGSAEVYCNYTLAGGKGQLASNGTITDIKWSVKDGKLALEDESGKEVSLNAGTTWIGYASSNNGGKTSVK